MKKVVNKKSTKTKASSSKDKARDPKADPIRPLASKEAKRITKRLEKEVKERSKKESEKEQQEAEVPVIQPGFGGRLMLTQGNGFPAQAPPPMMPNGTGFGIPPVRPTANSVDVHNH